MLEVNKRLRIPGEGFRPDNLDCIAERCPASEVAIIRHVTDGGQARESDWQDAGRDDPGEVTPLQRAHIHLTACRIAAERAATDLHKARIAVLKCEDEEAAKKWVVASSSSQTNSSPVCEIE